MVNRTLVTLVIAALFALALPHSTAHAQAPTPEQLDQAKKAFAEGKALYDAKKLVEAAEKFKESYKLSKNPLLLYNVGLALDEAKQRPQALVFYRKFLADAPPEATQRAIVTDRVKVLEEEEMNATMGPGPGTGGGSATETHDPTKIKPAGTYGPNDFQHQIVDTAPPGKPLDITASVPEDSGFTVTLFYRGSGDAKFTGKDMKWRYKELVARVPAAKVAGSSIQYYIEVKDQTGNVVTRSGKSTSPNLIDVQIGAPPRFYPDLTDEGTEVSATETKRHDEENPLGGPNNQEHDTEPDHVQHAVVPEGPKDGFLDPGSTKFRYTKWGSTYAAVGLIGIAVTFNILAHNQANALQNDLNDCPMGGTPPCRPFDSYDKDLQDAGKRDQTISNVALGFGIAATAVAGFYWYKELRSHSHGETKQVTSKNKAPEMTWVVTPAVGDGFTGAAAAARF
jgi:tetratricopeptide (TPR) repeat protein